MKKYTILLCLIASLAIGQNENFYVTNKILCELKKDSRTMPPSRKPVLSKTLTHPMFRKKSIQSSVFENIFEIEYMKENEVSPVYSDVNCTKFPDEAKSALQRATLIWSSYITSSIGVKMKACWSSVSLGSTLAITTTHSYFDNSSLLIPDTFYPTALYSAITGVSRGENLAILFNGKANWYYKTDAKPGDKMDFLTTAVHELAHGLGFSGGVQYRGSSSYYGDTKKETYPNIYDTFLINKYGENTIDLDHSPLGEALTSNALYFNGENANKNNGNKKVKLYAPSTWENGSSYSHLDDDTFGDGNNRLMTTTLMQGDAIHDPGSVTVGIFRDLGWKAPRVVEIKPISTQSTTTCDTFTFTPELYVYLDVKWTLESAPSGMSINSSTGKITWQNPIAGVYGIKVKATYISGDSHEKTFYLNVEESDEECKTQDMSAIIMYLLN